MKGVTHVAIYAISDLHLSFNKEVDLYHIQPEADILKPMDVFGWTEHYNTIRDHWLQEVDEGDTVLIPGDISWAMKMEQARYDFGWIDQLPGRKVCSPGNHCYYVQSKAKVRKALPQRIEWLDGDYTVVEGKVLVATRGWNLPGDRYWEEERDRRIYDRQVGRLRMALEVAAKEEPDRERIAMIHYPPVSKHSSNSEFMEVMRQFGVTTCLYGHLHGGATKEAIEGEIDGIKLHLVSCDHLHFRPLKLSV
ncbi:metallophosphoesterase [Mechercharimyces sp. CAU 1602]|uniref:metallophosphoesterase n=1 Tax=Mechercharimyces sp. CAU 1602 TaxID=2973933 RepID=UPI0021632327|nr:metallophosphoesterase [Mechercharimyces sp. CAU 1602]MCS1350736.1 metallophosphoesterase [Mechercharimyces sp. CAU 1602]